MTSLCEHIDWVGYVDWNVRDFHSFTTTRGATYNAYLVRDEQTALIDTVKAPYADELLRRVRALTELEKVRYLVCNHAEPDHASALGAVVRACPNAEVVCNSKCRDALSRLQDTASWRFRIVRTGDTLKLGRRSLSFLETPMVHWPESMATFVPEEGVLFSMDGFGQHWATSGRFDDEVDLETALAEAKAYYANILLPLGRAVSGVLDKVEALKPRILATSHGIIWRRHTERILAAYRAWASNTLANRVLVVYDSMWSSTGKMAEAILDGVTAGGAHGELVAVRATDLSTLATNALDAAGIAVGSSTLNGGPMPALVGALAYLKGLRIPCRYGLAFGTYGWGKSAAETLDGTLKEMKIESVREPLRVQWRPLAAELEDCRAAGRLLAERVRARETPGLLTA